MEDFNLYFSIGIEHILTWEALDHLLFITALCLQYTVKEWKKVALLVTAFTIGHSITLMLSALKYIALPVTLIEFLIPLTIAAAAIVNLWRPATKTHVVRPAVYFLALFFGLIHGMAYATTILDLEGSEGLVGHVFAFNVGIEIAQLLVVAVVLFISFILVHAIRVPGLIWVKIGSLIIFLVSIQLSLERW
ncbi:MAG: HupE/UreJ family protein [Chitinophagaceae bacterium]|nr:HupE/UreJ family protein [Chitinophagaceae bacterium]